MRQSKILVVEDDQTFAKGLMLRLKASRYLPLWVADGVQALRVVRQERPDLMLLDLGLPGGDGFIILDRLSTLPIHVPVIVLTARDPLENKDRALEAGAEIFLQKPVANQTLLTAIQMVLDFYRDLEEMPSAVESALDRLESPFDRHPMSYSASEIN